MAKQKKNAVTLQYIPFEKLVFLENNPRTRTPDGLERMAADIKGDPTFYQNRPTLVNLVGGVFYVYAGDLRAHAAHHILGWAEIPCNVESDVPADVQKRRAILDNTHREEWDKDKLSEWGYDEDELEEMGVWLSEDDDTDGGLPNNALNSEKVEEDDYEVPEIEKMQTDIVLGDLFEIGEHRLLCGDSTKAEDIKRLMAGGEADLIVTDPPYGVAYVGKTADALTIQNDAMTPDQTFALWESALDNAMANMKDGGGIYATVPAGRLQLGFMRVMDERECLRQVMVWNKSQMVLGHSDYHYKHEPILYGWKPGASHYFTSDRTQTTVFDFEKPQRNGEHPTMKPVALWAKMISNSSKEGWRIYDPFLGSGTTMVAAHQLGRKCYGIELEPKYCDVILRRMLKLDNTLIVKRNGSDETDKWLKFVNNS